MAVGTILGQESPLKTVFGQEPNLEGDVSPTAEQMNVLSTNGGVMKGNINMGNNNITGLPLDPENNSSPVTKEYLSKYFFSQDGSLPVSKGGTGAKNIKDAKANLNIELLDNASTEKTSVASKISTNVAKLTITESGSYIVFAHVTLVNNFPEDVRIGISSGSGTRLASNRQSGNSSGISCCGILNLAGGQNIHANIQQFSSATQNVDRAILRAVRLF